MPDPQFNLANYGPAGGQLQSRFLVTVDPREAIPIAAAGPMYSTRPAHKLGLSGSAYRYGQSRVDGTTNLIPFDGGLVSIPYDNATTILSASRNIVADFSPNVFYDTGGDLYLGGLNTANLSESFTSVGTVGLSDDAVTGVGTAFTTATVGGYAYTPSFKNPRKGDFINIGGADYLIEQIISDTLMYVYPGGGNIAPGAAYTIKRFGFHSWTRPLFMNTVGWAYSVCNFVGPSLNQGGTLCAYTHGGTTFKTGPQNVSNQDIFATDIAYYKSFLFYATGSAISWSLAGFPNTIPFAQSDFPAINTTVVDNTDVFVAFEYLGDQLVAIFQNSIWLIVPTGTIPEFNFYKLPENRGCNVFTRSQLATTHSNFTCAGRLTCSAAGAVYYMNRAGVVEFNGSIGRIISDPINDLILPASNALSLNWEPNSDSILLNATSGTTQFFTPVGLIYSRKAGTWSNARLDLLNGVNISPKRPLYFDASLQFGQFSYSITGGGSLYNTSPATIGTDFEPSVNGTHLPWSWASPVINVSDVYEKFQFGGFVIDAHGDNSKATPTLNWQIWAGTSPYNLSFEDSGTYNYLNGTISSRDMLGKKIDKPFVAIRLSGTKYIKLNGVLIYDARTLARR